MPSITEAVCPICNSKFVKKKTEQKYCSHKCAYLSLSLSLKGKNKWTEEQKRKHGNYIKALWQNPEYREKMMKKLSSPDYRRRLSEIHKKISKPWFKPPPSTEELKAKRKEGQIRYWTEERRKNWGENNPSKRLDVREKLSKSIKAFHEKNPEFAKKVAASPTWRQKVSENSKKLWKERREELLQAIRKSNTPEVVKKRAEARKKYFADHPQAYAEYRNLISKVGIETLRKRLFLKPNRLEKWFIDVFKKYALQIDYVGDGSFLIKTERGYRNPDFKMTNSNKLIEVGSPPWHDEEDFRERVKLFAEMGFECKTFLVKDPKHIHEDEVLREVTTFIDHA